MYDQPPLRPRELQVEQLLLTGLSGKQIAAKLSISTKTCEKYVAHVFRNRGVSSRPELMARFLHRELPKPGDIICYDGQEWELYDYRNDETERPVAEIIPAQWDADSPDDMPSIILPIAELRLCLSAA